MSWWSLISNHPHTHRVYRCTYQYTQPYTLITYSSVCATQIRLKIQVHRWMMNKRGIFILFANFFFIHFGSIIESHVFSSVSNVTNTNTHKRFRFCQYDMHASYECTVLERTNISWILFNFIWFFGTFILVAFRFGNICVRCWLLVMVTSHRYI